MYVSSTVPFWSSRSSSSNVASAAWSCVVTRRLFPITPSYFADIASAAAGVVFCKLFVAFKAAAPPIRYASTRPAPPSPLSPEPVNASAAAM